MKRILAFVLAVVFAIMLAGCNRQENAKQDIFNLVEEKYDAIRKACEEKDRDALSAIPGITEAKFIEGYVLVYCKGAGIAPSSQEYGFYYSKENRPVAVFDGQISCDSSVMVPEGKGYQYLDSGHNTFYTEHIKGNIYFYSAST